MATQSVPANRRSVNQDKFTWSIPGSRKKISLRSAAYLTLRQTRAFAAASKKGNTTGNDLLLDLAYTAADREVMEDLPVILLKKLMEAWQKEGQEALGK